MKLYNSLTKKIESIVPRETGKIGMYACGPTVYDYPHIGNWRTFVLGDILVRGLEYEGFVVDYLMNITDVGHLTGDNLGDASQGEDRQENAAKREGKTAWEVAKVYTDDFLVGYNKLHLTRPKQFVKATDHIDEQIEMVKKIEARGFTYVIEDGVYFDVQAYEAAGNSYGLMSNIHIDDVQARIATNTDKKDARDFALWKFSSPAQKRDMEWDSPWGKGFPGWHIECSAMSCAYLGEQFDIHVGGEDHMSTHHPNEIAQAEAATGKKPFVKYWVHGAFLTVDGGRMGKSLGNAYTLQDIKAKSYDPLDLRYFYLTGHYRKQLNFTWEALGAAAVARRRLVDQAARFANESERTELSAEKLSKLDDLRKEFTRAVGNNLNMPEALAVVWELVKSNVPSGDKYELLVEFDRVLGLGIHGSRIKNEESRIPTSIQKLVDRREMLRRENKFEEADEVRGEIEKRGYVVRDGMGGVEVSRLKNIKT